MTRGLGAEGNAGLKCGGERRREVAAVAVLGQGGVCAVRVSLACW